MMIRNREVFLSYSHADAAFARSLANELSRRGVTVWIDEKRLPYGEEYDVRIQAAINQCSVFLVVLSPDAASSRPVKDEIHIALVANKRIIPIDYRPCEVPMNISRKRRVKWTSGQPDDAIALDELLSALAELDARATEPECLDEIKAGILGLLRSQLRLLDELIGVPALLKSRSGRGASTIGGATAEEWKKILGNEQKKIAGFELVVTVVGTLNAGKSTAINAIVGTEILPRDHWPMTSIPTRVRHRRGCTVPVLTITKLAPITALCAGLRGRLRELRRDRLLQVPLYHEPKCRAAIDALLGAQGRGEALSKTYEGFAAIHAFLGQLNSWVRLAQDPQIRVDLPLDRFVEIDDIPVIDVEFSHLGSMPLPGRGTFTLLDTPGLGEYSQTIALRKLFAQQLLRSSAVLMVVDCQDIKGEAEKKIRKELTALASHVGDRLFVLVNKFDQSQDEANADAGALSQYVSARLMPELHVSRDRVHVGSGLNAFLSHRALRDLENTGGLQDSPESPWLQQFCKKAFGVAWNQAPPGPEEARRAAERLWESSGFAPLVEDVVKNMASASSVLSLQAALDRTRDFAKRISASLRLRKSARIGDKASVQENIAQMQSQIDVIESAIVKAKQEIDEAARQVSRRVDDIRQRKRDLLTSEIDTIFPRQTQTFRSISAGRRHVEAGMTLLQVSYEKVVASMEDEVRRECQRVYAKLASRIREVERKIRSISEGEELGDLDLKISREATLIELTGDRLTRPTVRMTPSTTEREKRVPKSGWFGVLARRFGAARNHPDWGFEMKTWDVTRYRLNEGTIKQQVLEGTDERLSELHGELRQQIKKAFLSYRRALVETTDQLKGYQGDLRAGLESRAMKGAELDTLVGTVDANLVHCEEQLKQVTLIQEMIERISHSS